MSDYFRAEEMAGEKPFKCYNCKKTLITDLRGSNYSITLKCSRCKTEIIIKCKEVIPLKNIRYLAQGLDK